MSAKFARPLDLDSIELAHGAHSPDHTFCMMEAVAYVSGEPWSDDPVCVAKPISTFCRSWNDALSDEDRQFLKAYIPKLMGTGPLDADGDERLSYMALDWLIREFTPAFLDLRAELKSHAKALRELGVIIDVGSARAASAPVNAARAAAGDAAWAAAGDAVGDAARAAAGAAAWAAAGATAEKKLAPTVEHLQQSALALVKRMIEAKP
jgi:hypothetical protein